VNVWGHGHPDWTFPFRDVRREVAGDVLGRHWVSLPYDHGYADLGAVAADIPEALEVKALDFLVQEHEPKFIGLERGYTSEPWRGVNLPLDDRRGEGLQIMVETLTTWTPRRICGLSAVPPPRIGGLVALKSGADVRLAWAPEPRAAGGYAVYRFGAAPPLLVPLAAAPPPRRSSTTRSSAGPRKGSQAAPDAPRRTPYGTLRASRAETRASTG
jgi:hypothetical protein